MKKIIIILTFIACLTSCSAIKHAAHDNTAKGSTVYLSVEIFQTLNKNAALAWTKDLKIVRLDSQEELYYDGKTISGYFVLVDTYTYTAKNEMVKTVPVYIRSSEYRKTNK